MTVNTTRPFRRGVWLFPNAPAPRIVDAVVEAELLGLDEFWIGDEGVARDPFTLLAAAASATERIRLGIAVTNPYLRHPVTIAAEAMTIDELSGGRMILGLGPGGRMALGPAKVERARPLSTTRQALALIRAVARKEASAGYEPSRHAFSRDLEVHIGSRSEGFQRLASEAADGAFVGGLPESVLSQVVGWLRSVRPISIGLYGTGLAPQDDREVVRPRMIMPLADSPAYVLRMLGLRRESVVEAAQRFELGDSDRARAIVTDDVLDELVLGGDPGVVARRLAARVRTYQPSTIGLTFTNGDPVEIVRSSAAAFQLLDREVC